jgi:hypothetical protein
MKAAVEALMAQHKAPKALKTEMATILDNFVASKAESKKLPKVIVVDGVEYTWCTRHELYEKSTNIVNGRDCIAANKHWTALGKEVKRLNDELLKAATAGEDVQEIAQELKAAKETRSSRYNLEESEKYVDAETTEYDFESQTFDAIPEGAEIVEKSEEA